MSAPAGSVSALVDAVGPMCENAVDDVDIAVMLEADGLNDSIAAERYGANDVLALAQSLLRAVPLMVDERHSDAPADGQRIPYLRLAIRGVLYATPGLFYVTLARGIQSHAAVVSLVLVMMFGWALSQAIAVVAYRSLTRTGAPNTARVLRWCLVLLLPVVIATFAVVAATAGYSVATVAAAQLLYVLSATVLLFHERDRRLGFTLIPGALVSLVYLTRWPVPLPGWMPPVVFALTAAVTLLVACAVRIRDAAARRAPLQRPLRGEFAAALPHAVYGLMSALVVAFQPLWFTFGGSSASTPALDITMLPLVLIMGYAEIEARRLRMCSLRLARSTRSLAVFRRGELKLLLFVELRVAVLLALISTAVGAVMSAQGRLDGAAITRMGAYLALGCALIAGLVACALDRVGTVLAAFAAASVVVGAAATARHVGLSGVPTAGQSYLPACLVLFACLGLAALHVLRNPIHVG